jgi:glycine cleavage system H protein
MSYLFSAQHQWIQEQNDHHVVGITEHAQETLGDVVFVQLPKVGEHFQQNEVVCAVESVKAASDVFAPVSGTVTEVNPKLTQFAIDNSEELNALMDEKDYLKSLG